MTSVAAERRLQEAAPRPGDFQGRGKAAAARIRLEDLDGPKPMPWSQVWNRPDGPIEYLVDPIIARGEVVSLIAGSKVGKSLLAQECAAALATGRMVLGQVRAPMTVAYIDQEQTPDDWRSRLASMGYDAADDLSRLFLYDLQSWPPLDRADGGQRLLERVEMAGAELVVLDTVSKFLSGEENSADTMRALYRATLLPLKRAGVAVWLLDHSGKDPTRGARGSSAKGDDVDVVWQMTTRARDALTLRRTHKRGRHEVDTLYLQRESDPLAHVVESLDDRVEEVIDACLAKLSDLAPPADASRNTVAELLRKAGTKYRNETISEAYRRWREVFPEGLL